jgi:putative endonuclease
MNYHVYLARCADGSLYAGICLDPAARERAHNEGRGSKAVRGKLPLKIVYTEAFATKGEALRREAEIKRWPKARKESLVASG